MTDERERTGVGLTVDLSNVITFPKLQELKESGGPVVRERRKHDECRHGENGVTVNENDRTTKCRRCQKVIDPFEALLSITHYWDWEHTRQAKRMATEEAEKVHAELERLKAARSKARRSGAIRADSVTKTLNALIERLKRRSAGARSRGEKVAAEELSSFEFEIRQAKELLVAGKLEADQ